MDINENNNTGTAINKIADVIKTEVDANTEESDQLYKLQVDHYDGLVVFTLVGEIEHKDVMMKSDGFLHREMIVTKDIETVIGSILDSQKK